MPNLRLSLFYLANLFIQVSEAGRRVAVRGGIRRRPSNLTVQPGQGTIHGPGPRFKLDNHRLLRLVKLIKRRSQQRWPIPRLLPVTTNTPMSSLPISLFENYRVET